MGIIEWFKKVRWGKQIVDQALHLGIPILIVWLVYKGTWLVVIPACFIFFEREYYQSNPFGTGTFIQKLKNINYGKIDMIFLYISTIICIAYAFYKEVLL